MMINKTVFVVLTKEQYDEYMTKKGNRTHREMLLSSVGMVGRDRRKRNGNTE